MANSRYLDDNRALSVGGVFGQGVAVIKSNPLATLGTSFVLIALPQLLLGRLAISAAFVADIRGGLNTPASAFALVGAYALLVAILWLIAGGALVQATIAFDQGRKADLAEVLRVGVLRSAPLFVVYLLLIIGVWLGSILLVVPGIMLGVMWSVAMPAVVAERTGIFGAFGRSRYLTKGARWPVFGILLLTFVIYFLVSIAIGVLGVAGYGSLGAITGSAEISPVTPSIFVQILQALVTTVMITWLTTTSAAIFTALRHWKDGPDTDRLTEIFA